MLRYRTHERKMSRMTHQFTASHIKDSIDLFRYTKRLTERSMEQCPDDCLFVALDDESNSIAIIVKHMVGNMRSRWTNFLSSDGEKPDRNRDTEFEEPPKTRAELLALWEQGWKCLFDALEPLKDSDSSRTVTIRTEPHSVTQAINRQLAHYSYHCGQITFLAKHFAAKSGCWTAITIPRKKSAEFNARVSSGQASQR
jgi:uncharacterized damage-inducible protein DinB